MSNNVADLLKYGTSYFNPSFRTWNYMSTSIIVVGCGGTGGRLIPLLAQHIANHNSTIRQVLNFDGIFLKHELKLFLIDMDIVEAKNLKRQNFYSFDIDKNKAECMAERFSALYGMDIGYFCGTFDEAVGYFKRSGLSDGVRLFRENNIIFDCTDNLSARKSIENNSPADSVIISCGNEDTFGQVVVSTVTPKNILAMFNEMRTVCEHMKVCDNTVMSHNHRHKIGTLPTLLTMNPFFKDSETAGCAEVQLVNEQSMPINSLVAQLAYNAFYELVSGVSINYNIVKCNVNNTFSTSYINNPSAFRDFLGRKLCLGDTYDRIKKDKDLFKEFVDKIFIKNLRYVYNLLELIDFCNKNDAYGLSYMLIKLADDLNFDIPEDVKNLVSSRIK